MAHSIYELYGELWGQAIPGFSEDMERSLEPRGADGLYDAFAACDVGPDDLVLDAGSRDAGHAIELAKRFGCRCVAVDAVPLHLGLMRKTIAEAGMGDRVTAGLAALEALPFAAGSFDAIWCRDVLNHVELPPAFAEAARVLKPGSPMLIYVTLATERMEPREAARLYQALAIRPENMTSDTFEACARAAGFAVVSVDRIDSEWREHALERQDAWGELPALLRLARMRRREPELVARYGRERFDAFYSSDLWGIYQFLGKLCPTIYRLRKVRKDAA
jgi:SAM-dependent methyltransferase